MAKKKILMLCDHPLSTSGVGTQSRWLIEGLIATGKYSFRVFGGAMKHQNYDIVKVNEDFIIRPTDGFGTKDLLKMVLATEKPDALLLFTDPRFFIWVWEMEDEIHQICPITYWHLWDNDPWPEFNRVLYESTDLINCINWPTYTMVKDRFPQRTNYIPHAIPKQIYHQFEEQKRINTRKSLFGLDAEDKFIGLWVNRNARRKMPGDVVDSWSKFLNKLDPKDRDNCLLVMHTDPFDNEGTNLYEVAKLRGVQKNIFFSTKRVGFDDMNALYNSIDFCMNISTNEGFGLPTLEAMYTGKPIIAVKTGGLTKQVVNDDGSENGIALEPEVRNLVGSQMVPYIYEDHVSNDTVAEAILKMYKMSPDERKKLGQFAKENANKKYNFEKVVQAWDETLTDTIENWKDNYKFWEKITL
jgi:glycosyltransferase involved in cell wall biosynthesis